MAWVPFGGTWTALVAFAPLTFFLEDAMRGVQGGRFDWRRVLTSGFLFALPAYGVALSWVVPSLEWRSAFPHAVYAVLIVSLSLCAALAVLGSVHWGRTTRVPLFVTLPLCWVGLEWLLTVFPGMPFAWLRVGSALAWLPPLNGIGEIAGVSGLTAWTVGVGTALGSGVWHLVRAIRRRQDAPSQDRGRDSERVLKGLQVTLAAALILVPPIFGAMRDGDLRNRPASGEILAVQTGRVEVYDLDPEPILRRVLGSAAEAIVFPEIVFPHVDDQVRREMSDLASRAGVPVIVGAGFTGDGLRYNGSRAYFPDGTEGAVVRKRRLVPGVERRLPWLFRIAGVEDRGYAAGQDPGIVALKPDRTVGILICYDSAFPSLVRHDRKGGAEFTIIQSNDDWLDPSAPFQETIAYWQHATHAILRAVETRSGVVQVAATGWTFSVDPTGRLREGRPPAGEAALLLLPFWTSGRSTVFVALGDVLGFACALLLVVILIDWRRRGLSEGGVARGLWRFS